METPHLCLNSRPTGLLDLGLLYWLVGSLGLRQVQNSANGKLPQIYEIINKNV